MAELEERLCELSKRFNQPSKAYSILSRAAEKGTLVEVEAQFSALQKDHKQKTVFSIQLLIDYAANGMPLDGKPAAPLLQSNYAKNSLYDGKSQNLGSGNRRISSLNVY